ncbi:MAG: carbohydrate ABC transporter permease, partial [Scardovia wiggsiae]
MTTVSTSLHSGRGPALSGAGPVSSKKRGKGRQTRLDRTYYWMTVPAALIFAFFLYVPFIQGILYSFTNSQGFGTYKWIGLKNYIALFQDDRVWHAYGFSIFIAVICTVLINLIAMFLAVLLNSRIAFKNGFRAIYFIPYTLAVLVIGYVFKYIFMVPLPALGQALHI